jgi:large repetitive protein
MFWQTIRCLFLCSCLLVTLVSPAASVLVARIEAPETSVQTPGTFSPAGNMTTPRAGHTATLLPNGKVLFAGGISEYSPDKFVKGTCNCTLASAELYDPSTGMFTPVGDMTTSRSNHTATLLPNGRVLITGGNSDYKQNCNCTLASAELYDPSTGTFTVAGVMTTARVGMSAILLNNGKVLIAGGFFNGVLASSELYDPSTGTFTRTGDMTIPVFRGKGTLLNNGKVLISGGTGDEGIMAELYDPNTGTFSLTGGLDRHLGANTATLLTNGKVLVTLGAEEPSNRAALYDPSTETFTATGNMIGSRLYPAATLLADGTVLIAGTNYQGLLAELYDPVAGTFSPSGNMTRVRQESYTATRLPAGTVLIAGGLVWVNPQERFVRGLYADGSAEIFTPPLHVTFEPNTVRLGGSFTARFSGTNLTATTHFDVRFRRPGSSVDEVTLDWQQGPSALHSVTSDIASGTWTITGVRPHQSLDDHGDFFPVFVTLTISPF